MLATACACMVEMSFGQAVNAATQKGDYKDSKTHEHFAKRRRTVAAWEINQLKKGALVVRLKSNQKAVDGLRKEGKQDEADQLEAQQYLINKYIVRAYLDHYNFSKVLFMPAQYSDTLLKGNKSGFFVDSLLNPVPSAKLDGDFYLIAERDYVYNSSIGFVREDSARSVVEAGNPTREMAIVIKNKYGQQLKGPFPYFVKDRTYSKAMVATPIPVTYKGKTYKVEIPKELTYEKFSVYVAQLNEHLSDFLQGNTEPTQGAAYEDAKPFLY